MDLQDSVTLITGGARIGKAVAGAVTRAGSHLALTCRTSLSSASETARVAKEAGRQSLVIQVDLTKEAEIRKIIPKIRSTFGRLDVLINMASWYHEIPVENLDGDAFDRQMATDVKSACLLSLEAVPLMRENGGGRIINFVDWVTASRRPQYTRYLHYYTAKSAMQGLTEALALELAPDILVNSIAPGPILPPDDLTAEEYAAVERATPLGRWGGADQIAQTVMFLIQTEFITGEVIRVDGGRHLK